MRNKNILDGPVSPEPQPKISGAERAQSEAEEAFERSGAYTFQGHLLKAFSIERQAAAQRLGLKYGKTKPGEVEMIPIEIPEGKGKVRKASYVNYPGMLDDCILVLFLCTLEADEILRFRGSSAEVEFWRAAYQWAGVNGIGYLNAIHGEAFALFSAIMADLRSTAVDVSDPTPEHKREKKRQAPGN